MTREQRIKRLIAVIPELSNYRLQLIGKIADVFQQPKEFNGINRILILRALKKTDTGYLYELVEIPKSLLSKAANGRLEMRTASPQNPKPGYCYVEEDGKLLFSLYFDGGGERKLQVKHLQKPLCKVHATWKFELSTETL